MGGGVGNVYYVKCFCWVNIGKFCFVKMFASAEVFCISENSLVNREISVFCKIFVS